MPPKGSGKKVAPRSSPAAGHRSSREMGTFPKTTAASKPSPKVSSKISVKPKDPPSATPETDPNSHSTHPSTNISSVAQPEAAPKAEFEIQSESSDAKSLKDGSPLSYGCCSKVHNGHADVDQQLGIRTSLNKDVKRTTYLSPEDWPEISSKSKSKSAYDYGEPKEAYSCSPVSRPEDLSTFNFEEVRMAMKYFSLPENSSHGIHESQHGSSSFSKESKIVLLNTPPQFSPNNIIPVHSIDCSGGQSFDICESNSQSSKKGGPVKLKPSILAMNREKRKGEERSPPKELKPGMVYLKNYLTLEDQVKLIKECSGLGNKSGGFYQPSFSSGHKMHLHMMCLGKNWDPETSKYGDILPHDGTRPLDIPDYFKGLVQKVLQVAQEHLKNDSKLELPTMNPDICIVNFYSKSGKLGLHQDKDESPESIQKGLPVVSFSVGDSAEFLFGDDRDVEKAQKCRLDSGDVLIFGGKSRLVFHGVPTIFSDTAPKQLLEQTNLRPGRLNLTFRQY